MAKQFDLLVIGGGSGGIACAVRAAMYKQDVAVIEKKHLGGTCVNVGCVPKKVMWNASYTQEVLRKAASYGFDIEERGFDWGDLCERRDAYIARLRDIYQARFDDLSITHIQGDASFVTPHAVMVNEKVYQGKHVVICTGATPTLPNIPGIDYGITSDDFFELKKQPKKVAVLGSGYIGVELAGLLNQLGTEVHLFYRKALPLTGFDETLKKQLDSMMRQNGIFVHEKHQVKEIKKDKSLVFDKGIYEGFDEVLVTIGRRALTDSLMLGNAGISMRENQTIIVDDYQRTNVINHYAIGDLTGAPALTPVAIRAGRMLSERIFNKNQDAKLDVSSVPTVIFSHPPIATVGLTEDQAREQFEDINVYESRFNPMFDALSDHKTPVLMKLIVEGKKERVVGLHMIGQSVDEILQGFAVAIKMGATKKDFDDTIAIHPTTAEELVTMK